MVANWWDPGELVFPMFCLVILVYAGFAMWLVCSRYVENRDRRLRDRHVSWLRETQSRMSDPAPTASFADVAQTVVLTEPDSEIILSGEDLPDIPLARTVDLDDLPEQRQALALESRGGSDV
jgi:hypothetical protein